MVKYLGKMSINITKINTIKNIFIFLISFKIPINIIQKIFTFKFTIIND